MTEWILEIAGWLDTLAPDEVPAWCCLGCAALVVAAVLLGGAK